MSLRGTRRKRIARGTWSLRRGRRELTDTRLPVALDVEAIYAQLGENLDSTGLGAQLKLLAHIGVDKVPQLRHHSSLYYLCSVSGQIRTD